MQTPLKMNGATKDTRKKNIDETFKSATTNRNEDPLCRIHWQVNTKKSIKSQKLNIFNCM